LIVKADHPRPIDRYIDFFGDGTATARSDTSGAWTVSDERSSAEGRDDLLEC
jgi:hypothetical protein